MGANLQPFRQKDTVLSTRLSRATRPNGEKRIFLAIYSFMRPLASWNSVFMDIIWPRVISLTDFCLEYIGKGWRRFLDFWKKIRLFILWWQWWDSNPHLLALDSVVTTFFCFFSSGRANNSNHHCPKGDLEIKRLDSGNFLHSKEHRIPIFQYLAILV